MCAASGGAVPEPQKRIETPCSLSQAEQIADGANDLWVELPSIFVETVGRVARALSPKGRDRVSCDGSQ